MATIRELFHSLGNGHNMLTVGAGVTKELVEECLQEKDPQALKNNLARILKNLDAIIKNTKEADKKSREIKDMIYKVINPDTGELKENAK